jgi:LEA14-like dessication related protein
MMRATERGERMRIPALSTALLALGLAGCGLKAPTMQLQHLRVDDVNITGMKLDVKFQVRNPNPEPLRVQNFEYELKLNGRRLGRGYYPDSFELAGFGSESVVSSFDLSFLSLPAGVRRVLERDRVRAEVKGRFYVREAGSGSTRRLGFKSDAEVRIDR